MALLPEKFTPFYQVLKFFTEQAKIMLFCAKREYTVTVKISKIARKVV